MIPAEVVVRHASVQGTVDRISQGVVAVAVVVLVAAATPVGANAAEDSGTEVGGQAPSFSDEFLESAVDTRQRLGFADEPAYVAQLAGSAGDVGTEDIGLPLTATELIEVQRREAVLGLFYEGLEAYVRGRPDFGGVYVDQLAGGIVVVLTTGDAEALEAELHEAEPRLSRDLVVRRTGVTAAQLDEAAARLFRERQEWSNGIPVQETGVDYQHAQVLVVVAPDEVDAAPS